MQTLSKKGVLFLTSGFHQHYVFQNIAHLVEEQSDHSKQKSLKIILSDGQIYISGVFKIKTGQELDKCKRIQEFDLLRILASYEGGTKPILISSLQIFSQKHKGIYGLPPISLKDYMESRLLRRSNGFEPQPNKNKCNHVEEQKKNEIFLSEHQNGFHEPEKNNQIFLQKSQKVVLFNQSQQNEKHQLSFELSNEQSEYDLLKDLNEIQTKKRDQRVQNNQEIQNNPQKKLKPNEDQHQQGEMVLKQFNESNEINNNNENAQKIVLQTSLSTTQKIHTFTLEDKQDAKKTQKILIKKYKEIEIIDLDSEPTQKQPTQFYGQSNRRQYRQSHLKFIQEILQSEEKQTQKQTFSYKSQSQQQHNDSITIPRSQTLVQQNLTTPMKQSDNDLVFNPSNQQMIGSTTQRKILRQQYNLLIQNLYESNSSFKIICRVNNLYEWRSKNGTPCLALDLMDSIGDEIKAIVYMNHSSRQCKQCGSMVEVGKVYCFQNGQCKRDLVEKEALQLVFNLRTKTCWTKEIPCGGRNKIIPASKIKIQPIFQNKIQSLSQLIQHVQSGKNVLTSVYGILQSFKFNQFEKKSNNNENNVNERQEDKSDPQIQFIDLQNLTKQKAKTSKKSNIKASNKQGPTNIYLNGFLADPIQRKKIGFACVIPKPLNGTQIQSAQNFLVQNGIKKGTLVILHNVKVQSTNNGTVHKLQKTKKTYMQILTDRNIKWQYIGNQFASQTVSIKDIDEGSQLYPTLKQMLSLTQRQIDSIMENPRVINYSKQPFTERSIFDLNQLLQKSMMPDQNCFSEIKGVKIHSIEQKPSVDICFYCKKKARPQQQKSNNISHAIKHCQRCKMIVKTITMHIFNIIFADDTASFLVQVLKDEYLETLLGMKIQDFLEMEDHQRRTYLELIKYSQFSIKLRSQKKMGSVIHKINSIQKMPIKARLEEIKQQKKGIPKHYQRLDSSW